MANPIWKDFFVTLGSTDGIDYRVAVQDTGEVIYQGRAFIRPGDTSVRIRINDICADYYQILASMPRADSARIGTPVVFDVEVSAAGAWSRVASVEFVNDWSYDYLYNVETDGMADPINGRIDRRMPFVYTMYHRSSVSGRAYFEGGISSVYSIASGIVISDYNTDDSFTRAVSVAGSGTAVLYLSTPGLVGVSFFDKRYEVVDTCAEYALYYLNAYGGWDFLLMEGSGIESDAIVRHSREVEYDNTSIRNRGTGDYVNEVRKGFTLHTGWLTGDQGKRMHHLINSTDVFLYRISTEEMIPVTISSPTCEYKTFKNQGNQLVNYAVEVEVAQNRLRR